MASNLEIRCRRVFVTGGTGYLGGPLLTALLARGHEVRALARPGSEHLVGVSRPARDLAAPVPV